MINKYINEHIDQSVNVEPNFNKIDHSINYEQFNNIKRFSKNNILKFISILCPTCIMIIGTILLINNLGTTPPEPTPILPTEPSGIVNEFDASNEPTIALPFFYKITTDKCEYSIGEEVKITLELGLSWFQRNCFEEGDLNIKISNDESYEVIGQSEYIIEDFITIIEGDKESKYYATNDNRYPIRLVFTIKPTSESFRLSTIDFSMKFRMIEQGKQQWKESDNNGYLDCYYDWWFDFDEEYIFHLRGTYFINDKESMKLSLDLYKLVESYINVEYKNGIIDKDIYMDRLFESLTLGKISIIYRKKSNRLEYYSKNIRFQITLSNEESEFIMNVINLLNDNKNKEAAAYILNYMNDHIEIPLEVYDAELKNIDINNVETNMYKVLLNIPFNDYEEYIFDYKYHIN